MPFLASCAETIEVSPPPPPQDYLTCQKLPKPPEIAPLSAFRAPNGVLVYSKADVDVRDASIARYIVDVRGAWFDCSNQLQRVSDYYEAQD
jgi:hypothetical protein